MTITNITPREQNMQLEIEQIKTERDHWRRLATEYRHETDKARELLDNARKIIRDLDQKVMRSKV